MFPEDFDKANAIVEVIEHQEPQTERSIARRLALQVLYEVDAARHDWDQVLIRQLDYHAQENPKSGRGIRTYLRDLVDGVMEHYPRLDRVVKHYAPDFPLVQMALIDRNILRLAIYEIGISQSAPVPVIIDEAVNLAQVFGSDTSPNFVNGVLGSLADHLETLQALLGDLA